MSPTRNTAQFAGICGLAFLLLLSYEVSRSAIESLFLQEYETEGLPWAWLAVAGVATVVVVVYNRFAPRASNTTVFAVVVAISVLSLGGLMGLFALEVPGTVFALYVWKDVHIVVLIEVVWTIANLTYDFKSARRVYGLFCAAGSLGSVAGGLLVGVIADRYGTVVAMGLPAVLLTAAAALAVRLGRHLDVAGDARPDAESVDVAKGVAAVMRSSYLLSLVMLVAVVQVAIAVIDYEYNSVLVRAFEDVDERTRTIGHVYVVIAAAAFVLQLVTRSLLRFVGEKRVLVAVPLMLGSAVVAFLLSPGFVTVAITKVASKALDYSVFRAAKELLYLPLSRAEKTQGKAVVDMWTYRVAKAGASGLMVALIYLGLEVLAGPMTAVLLVAWVALTLVILRQYAARRADVQ